VSQCAYFDTPSAEEGCGNAAARRGLCWTHLRRQVKGLPLSAPVRRRLAPLQRVLEIARRIEDANTSEGSDRDFGRARAYMRKALERYRASVDRAKSKRQ
jgi:hypothetical protein